MLESSYLKNNQTQLFLTFINAQDIKIFFKNIINSKIKSLNLIELSGSTLNDKESADLLNKIIETNPVKNLQLVDLKANSKFLNNVFNYLKHNKTIEEINLSGIDFTVLSDNASENFEQFIKTNTTIKSLYFGCTKFSKSIIKSLFNSLELNTSINFIFFSDNIEKFDNEDLSYLIKFLQKSYSLKTLKFAGIDFNSNLLKAIADGIKYNSSITKLDFTHCSIENLTDDDLKYFENALTDNAYILEINNKYLNKKFSYILERNKKYSKSAKDYAFIVNGLAKNKHSYVPSSDNNIPELPFDIHWKILKHMTTHTKNNSYRKAILESQKKPIQQSNELPS